MNTTMHDPDPTPTRPPTGSTPDVDSPLRGLDAGGLLGAAAAADPAVGVIQPLFPSYRIVERIGRGATSSVYRARHRKLDRSVAIKILDPELGSEPGFLARFQREAQATARLQHPFIVTVLDFGDVEGVLYLVLEDCGGRTLRDLLARGADARADVLRALAQVAEALDYAHGERAVHRDLKPENVLVDAHGYPRIADFGLARVVEPGTPRLTRTGDVMGTPHYMAPEQVQGHDADHRADVYALGVMTYEALTGTLPVGRFDPPDVASAAHHHLADLVMRALSPDPSARPPLRELQRALAAAATTAASTGPVAARVLGTSAEPAAALPTRTAARSDGGAPKPPRTRAQTIQLTAAIVGVVAVFLPWVQVQVSTIGTLTASGAGGDGRLLGLIPVPGWLLALATISTAIAYGVAQRRALQIPSWVAPSMAGVGLLWCAPVLFLGFGTVTRTAATSLSFSPAVVQDFGRVLSAQPLLGAFVAAAAYLMLGIGWYHERYVAPRAARPRLRRRARGRARRLGAVSQGRRARAQRDD